MSKYIIKNCPAYDCSITEWNCLGSDATECKNGNCIMKQIVNECANSLRFSCERILAEKLLGLLDIQEVE